MKIENTFCLHSKLSLVGKLDVRASYLFRSQSKIFLYDAGLDKYSEIYDESGVSVVCSIAYSKNSCRIYISDNQIVSVDINNLEEKRLSCFPDNCGVRRFLHLDAREKKLYYLRRVSGMDLSLCLFDIEEKKETVLQDSFYDFKIIDCLIDSSTENIYLIGLTVNGNYELRKCNSKKEYFYPIVESSVCDFSVSCDGSGKIYFSNDNGINIYYEKSNTIKNLVCFGNYPSPSPSGDKLVFLNGGSELWFVDINSCEPTCWVYDCKSLKKKKDISYSVSSPKWSRTGSYLWFSLETVVSNDGSAKAVWENHKVQEELDQLDPETLKVSKKLSYEESLHKKECYIGILEIGSKSLYMKNDYWRDFIWIDKRGLPRVPPLFRTPR